jgi:hypothetical protein
MTLDASGNLGIGTTSPAGKLQVVTSSGVAQVITNSDATNGFGLKITAGGSASARYALHVLDPTDTTSYFKISTETGAVGNVGIGTASPAAKLDVNGSVRDSAGNVRDIPSAGAAKTSEYTLTISDIGEFVTIGTSGKVLIPNNTFATGNAISVYNDTTGNVSLNISTTTGYVVGTNTNRTGVTLATRGIANILFINPSYCILSGNLT